MLAYIPFPSWIKPEIIPGLPFRWYALMYLVAFAIAWLLFRYQSRSSSLEITEETLSSYFFWGILGLLLGARIFSAFIYDTSGYYWQRPWAIFWPFRNGRFVGLQGMSYHGGVVGAVTATLIYCRVKKISWLTMADLLAAAIPLGYTFGRLGNFINGELWGRVTAAPIGMVFPRAPQFPLAWDWVRRIADEVGLAAAEGLVNLPRHPSQLYEALFEGIVLWLFLWFVVRKRSRHPGTVFGSYLIGYGVVRFFIEYFREPDADIGFPIELVDTAGQTYLFVSPWNFSTGQILCFLMILTGAGVVVFSRRRGMVKLSGVEEESAEEAGERRRKERRKRRKKLR